LTRSGFESNRRSGVDAQIHSQMLESLLRAKMTFFTQTRAGSIVQRFGKDLNDTIDCSELFGEVAEVLLHSAFLRDQHKSP